MELKIGALSLKVYQEESESNVGKDGITISTLIFENKDGLMKKIKLSSKHTKSKF